MPLLSSLLLTSSLLPSIGRRYGRVGFASGSHPQAPSYPILSLALHCAPGMLNLICERSALLPFLTKIVSYHIFSSTLLPGRRTRLRKPVPHTLRRTAAAAGTGQGCLHLGRSRCLLRENEESLDKLVDGWKGEKERK